jgi:hypothetical protein
VADRSATPMLDALAHCGTLRVARQSDGKFRIYEYGGAYCEFTADQLTELAGELLALVASIT